MPPSHSTPRRRRLLMAVVTLVLLAALGAGVGEAVVRAIGTWTPDGNFIFRGNFLPPTRLPVKAMAELLAREKGKPHYIVYDETLGWTIAPNARSEDGLYRSNSLGIRCDEEVPLEPPTGFTKRVVLLGDSFTHGDEVAYEDSYAVRLAAKPVENVRPGILPPFEIVNLGVPGYGFDQVLLRWRTLGAKLHPAIVVLGFCHADIERVVNVYRWFADDNGIYTKPRFTLEKDGSLALHDVPTIPPEKIPDFLAHFEGSALAALERHYAPEEYEDGPLFRSKLAALIAFRRRPNWRRARVTPLLAPDAEAGALSLALVAQMKREVEASGARFCIVYMPIQFELKAAAEGRDAEPFAPLLEKIAPLIRPEKRLLALCGERATPDAIDGLFQPHGHYKPPAQAALAAAVAEALEGERR